MLTATIKSLNAAATFIGSIMPPIHWWRYGFASLMCGGSALVFAKLEPSIDANVWLAGVLGGVALARTFIK